MTRKTGEREHFLPALALLRFVAIGGVIWTHAWAQVQWDGEGFDFGNAGRFGSAFFTQCSVFLALQKNLRRTDVPWAGYARGRFQRVYVPFLLWSALYVLAQDAHNLWLDGDRFTFTWALLWNGSEYHLWFLPFIYVVGLALFALGRWLDARPHLAIPVALLCVVIGAVASAAYLPIPREAMRADYMPRLSWNRVPSACWAAAIAIMFQYGGREALRSTRAAIVGAAAFIGSILMLGFFPALHVFENVAGVGVLLLGLSIVNTCPLSWSAPLGALAYGMYLGHPLLLSGLRILWRASIGPTDHAGFAVVVTACVIVASAVLTVALRRTPGLRLLVPA